MIKQHGYRGMDSSQASYVKREGHNHEYNYARICNMNPDDPNIVIPGTDKADIRQDNGRLTSLKSGKKSQYCMVSSKRVEKLEDAGDIIKRFILPFEDYLYLSGEEQIKLKKDLQGGMKTLKDHLKHPSHLKKFIRKIMFSNADGTLVDFIALRERYSLRYHLFLRQDVEDIFCKKTEVVNSEAKSEGQMDAQKTIIKGEVNNSIVSIIDNEVRTKTPTSTNFLAHGWTEKLLKLLTDNINKKSTERENEYGQIISHGEAIGMTY